MFELITPEAAGISSHRVHDYIDYLERRGVVMHSVLLAKGDSLFAEAYWHPFDRDFCHRMYSETKSYTAIAIGLLEEEGKLSLDDTIASHFPELCDRELPPALAEQTIRDTLLMRTSSHLPVGWFRAEDPDRTHLYLNTGDGHRRPATLWEYDSAGSQVLASLAEKLSGKSLFDYLNEKIFRHLGTFKTAEILKTRNGDSWGDSALICTSRDMLSFARFLMKGGVWDGRRLMNEEFIKTATSRLADNHTTPFTTATRHGYGYQIWRFEQGFGFNGMGGQFTVCVPECDLVFVCTADNQGNLAAGDTVINGFFDYIVRGMGEAPLPEDPEGVAALDALTARLTLAVAPGEPSSPLMARLSGRTYVAEPNRTGITRFSFTFLPDGTGVFRYTNAQGDKVLPFGLGKNVFTKFPQYGYSDGVGGAFSSEDFFYRCASSAAFGEEAVLHLRVQIIDRYFGNMLATFAFRDDDVAVRFTSAAENFLGEYQGLFTAKAE